MACMEGERLKSEVLDKIEEYLQAEEAQRASLEQFGDTSLVMAEHAYESLSESRRRFWTHVRQHQCEDSFEIPSPADPTQRIAV